jgi:hypothetical protein
MIYSKWLREQFCNLTLYTLHILSLQYFFKKVLSKQCLKIQFLPHSEHITKTKLLFPFRSTIPAYCLNNTKAYKYTRYASSLILKVVVQNMLVTNVILHG